MGTMLAYAMCQAGCEAALILVGSFWHSQYFSVGKHFAVFPVCASESLVQSLGLAYS